MTHPTPDLSPTLAPYINAVEAEMRAIVTPPEAAFEPFYGMLRYHMGWTDENFWPIATRTGKRLRPVFCLLVCEALGGDWQVAVPAAACLELTHNFSLIHDDIEDRDDERHGRLTLWKRWGEAQAINAGDGLFVLARLALAELVRRGISVEVLAAVSVAYDQACLAITEGQFLDMEFETRLDVTEGDYLRMVTRKTAALLSAATQIGALLANTNPTQVASMANFGREVGLAFQIIDDLLGIWGDPTLTGKQAANDIRRRKKSLPVAYALEHAAGMAQTTLRRIYGQTALSEYDIKTVLEILEECGAREHVQRLADFYHTNALSRLDGLTGPTANLLMSLTQSLTRRQF